MSRPVCTVSRDAPSNSAVIPNDGIAEYLTCGATAPRHPDGTAANRDTVAYGAVEQGHRSMRRVRRTGSANSIALRQTYCPIVIFDDAATQVGVRMPPYHPGMAQTKIWTGDPVWIADVLRAEGVKLVEYPGWQNRGHGDFKDIRGVMVHHTGSDNVERGVDREWSTRSGGSAVAVAHRAGWHCDRGGGRRRVARRGRHVSVAADEYGQLAHDRHRVRQQRYRVRRPHIARIGPTRSTSRW